MRPKSSTRGDRGFGRVPRTNVKWAAQAEDTRKIVERSRRILGWHITSIHTYGPRPALAGRAMLRREVHSRNAPDAPHCAAHDSHTFTARGYWARKFNRHSNIAAAAADAAPRGQTAEELHRKRLLKFTPIYRWKDKAAARRIVESFRRIALASSF